MKANGEIHLIDMATGKCVTHATVQCPHCARHVQYQKGSGKLRPYCMSCGQFTCGHPKCVACVHWRQKDENLEGGLDVMHRPVIVQSVDVRGLATR